MKLTIAGCGNMGMIYARAFLKYDIVSSDNLILAEKNEARKEELKKLNMGKVTVVNDNEISNSDIIILSVKPQDFDELSKELKSVVGKHCIVISIMAGMQISYIQNALGTSNIIRAMPNSPAELGLGMTGYTASKTLTVEQVHKAENLLSTTGRSMFFEDEKFLDSVTAISGSGPAYFFYIVKSMIEAGKQMGIEESVAAMLVKQTMLGSFHLLNSVNKPLDELIKTVASKGGTTEATLSVFNEGKIDGTLIKGLLRAEQRAKELSKK